VGNELFLIHSPYYWMIINNKELKKMTTKTLIRGSTQIRDESISLNKLSPAVQSLLLRTWIRKDFSINQDGVTDFYDAEFQPEKFTEVYVNGVLQTNILDYHVGSENIHFNVPLTIGDNVSVFCGNKPIYEQMTGEQLRRQQTVALIGGSIKPYESVSRWYPTYKSIVTGVYGTLGVVSNVQTVLKLKRNGECIKTFVIPPNTHRGPTFSMYEVFTPPDDYMTVEICECSDDGDGLNIMIDYLMEPQH
jgi:hypothetical protein